MVAMRKFQPSRGLKKPEFIIRGLILITLAAPTLRLLALKPRWTKLRLLARMSLPSAVKYCRLRQEVISACWDSTKGKDAYFVGLRC